MSTTSTFPAGDGSPAPSSRSNRPPVDLTKIPTVPFAMVDEHVFAAIRGCSVKTIQRERSEGIGCRYRKINGASVRYKMADIFTFLEAQPAGGGGECKRRGPGRPKGVAA
jgi:hypothetical protein